MDLTEYIQLRGYIEYLENCYSEDPCLEITNLNKKSEEGPKPKEPPKLFQFNNIPENSPINTSKEETQINNDISKVQINKDKIDLIQIKLDNEKTRETTNKTYKEKKTKLSFLRISLKKNKIPDGEWLDYYQTAVKKESIIKNNFLKNHPELYKDTINFFCKDPPKFISHRVIELKMAIVDYGQMIINDSIKNEEQALYYISYLNFCVPLQKNFVEENYEKTMGILFVKYQENNKGLLENHNKKVVEYIKNNKDKEKEANDLINLSFYELTELFTEFYLEEYLQKKKEEMVEVYKTKISEKRYTTIVKAFLNIIETICKEFKEYNESIKGRIIKEHKKK